MAMMLLNGCAYFEDVQPTNSEAEIFVVKKPLWITNPSYNGKLAAVGKAGYAVYDKKQEEIAINQALLQLVKLSSSDVTLEDNIQLSKLKTNIAENTSYDSDTKATIITSQNIKAKITNRYKDKDGYLYIRLEKIR